MSGDCAGGSSQLAAQCKYLGYYRLPRSCKAYPGIWKLSEDEQIFVTGRQEDQMCAQNLFCGLFSPLFYHRSKFCRTIFHLHGHKHDQLSSSAQQRFHPTWGYIQSLTDTCIVAVPLLGTPTQLPAPSQNRGQSSQAVLAQESWAVRRGLSQPQCTW